MKKIISTLTLLCGLAGAVLQAGPAVEKILLKNGTVLEGYISKQRPGKDIVFTSSKAVVYLPAKEVKNIANHSVGWQMLSPAWQQWAEANAAVRGSGKDKTVLLSDITKLAPLPADSARAKQELPPTTFIPKVRILEEGAIVKYLDLAPVAYTLSWDTVQFIRRDKRGATDLTGLNDVVELKNAGKTVEGQIIEQVPGKLLRLLKNNGIVEVIEQAQIARQKKVKVNPNQDLFEQSPLLDIVETRDGPSFRGIIVEQYFGDAKAPSYLLIQTPEGSLERVEHARIAETRREENPRYRLLTDVILDKGEWRVNRRSVKNAVTEERDDLIILSPQSDSLVFRLDSLDNRLVLEAHFANEYEADDIALLKISPKLISKKEYGNAFTFKDIVTNNIRYTAKETSLNHTTKLVYPVSSRGYYVLYEPRHKRTVLCVIK